MSLSICAECLSRLRISSTAIKALPRSTPAWTQTSSFHRTATQYKSPLVKKKSVQTGSSGGNTRSRQSQSARLKKKTRDRPKLPPVGERRAQRRRIVLSNTNAIPVSGMETWTKENVAEEKYIGQMMALNGELLDQLRDSRAFKTTQNWSLFRRPAVLIREETVRIARDMIDVEDGGDKKLVKHLVTGERASGKSLLILQTMSMAYMKGWLVLNIPEAQEFVNNTSSYTPFRLAEDSSQIYNQPHLTQLLLQRAVASNETLLRGLKLNHTHSKPLTLGNKATLYDLAQLGAQDFHLAHTAWQALYKELSDPGVNFRPPVLLAADGVDHWMGPSLYRNAEHKLIHAHQFSLVRQLVRLLFSTSQEKSFINGGMVFFSTSGSNSPAHPTFELLLSQMRAVQRQHISPSAPDFPLPKPYSKPDERILALTGAATAEQNVNLLDLKGLSRKESRGYLEYFARSGLLHQRVTDGFVGEMRGLSGGGVVGELARLGRRVVA
ncbi:hypothetical protein H2200_009157 [Cladophialophora chaetospira]|uniref:Small ribosomal subunit protein mS29 n=1 Tax=Cladophialophora chaetospira TaxID=386627 RepID=A0AA38X3S9_9EURO|nr:hypothetical protein H2200_009157 [Cladophialophora chaetospira]